MAKLMWFMGGIFIGFVSGGFVVATIARRLFDNETKDTFLDEPPVKSPWGLPVDEDYGKVKK